MDPCCRYQADGQLMRMLRAADTLEQLRTYLRKLRDSGLLQQLVERVSAGGQAGGPSLEAQQVRPQSGPGAPLLGPAPATAAPATPGATLYAQLLAAAGQPGTQQMGLTSELVGTYMAAFSGMTPDRQRHQMELVAVALGAGPEALAPPLLHGVTKIASMRPGGLGQ